ncbi:hypothetical protein [Leisingera aquaemixtae]|uniref:Uncharacterized protein n=1 Tax=Leisingera aquaemixtae TaxID=1396826 RepID=A0A0P1HX10_9RHOB|nr:hypothetical protein [Leisingera aquaemixtae]CUH99861.1 hypothetical protein PHA8399_01987 [Leisingera aquaemixtae]
MRDPFFSCRGGLRSPFQSRRFPILALNPALLLDLRDATTVFQDASGSALAEPSGDPVRLVLDASLKLERGAELWKAADAVSQAIWTEAGGVYTKAETGSAEFGLTTLSGLGWYEVAFTILASSGALNLWRRNSDGSANEQVVSSLSTGDYRLRVRAGPTVNGFGSRLWFNGSSFVGTLSNLSFRALPGNHAMAPSDAARPTYEADKRLSDDGVDDALIAPLTGLYSAYVAAGASLIVDENVAMANDYNVLRDDMTGAVIVPGILDAAKQRQIARYFGVSA